MPDMPKKSGDGDSSPKNLQEAKDIIAELRASLAEKEEALDAADTASMKERDELEGKIDEAHDKQHEAEFILHKFGGHQDCLMGAVTGRKLHPACTCGWNEHATELERTNIHAYG